MRELNKKEKKLLKCLLKYTPNYKLQIDEIKVEDLKDGGMGSLYFISKTRLKEQRVLGKYIFEKEFLDSDGIPISVAINIDDEGELFELDIWKVDFSTVIKYPEC